MMESYAVLDTIAGIETGAMDKPVEDVVIETVKSRTKMKIGDKLTRDGLQSSVL